MTEEMKIGVVSCSGEACLGGTISRLATRKILEEVHPNKTITICLPLFLASGQEERMFTKKYPTIAVDGCKAACAKRATEKYSGKVSSVVFVSDLVGHEQAEGPALSTRDLSDDHRSMVDKVVAAVIKQIDEIVSTKQVFC